MLRNLKLIELWRPQDLFNDLVWVGMVIVLWNWRNNRFLYVYFDVFYKWCANAIIAGRLFDKVPIVYVLLFFNLGHSRKTLFSRSWNWCLNLATFIVKISKWVWLIYWWNRRFSTSFSTLCLNILKGGYCQLLFKWFFYLFWKA